MLKKAGKTIIIFLLFIILLHSILYFISNHVIKNIESNTLDDLKHEIPGRFIPVMGSRVHIIEKGKGKPVIYIHGFAGSTYNWEQTIYNNLPENNRSIFIDLFGMGFSERSDSFNYDFPFWTEQVYGTLKTLNIRKVSIVGLSLGGSVASMFAANYPDYVEKLILISSLAPFDITDFPLRSLIYFIPGGGEIILTIPAIFNSDLMRYKRIGLIRSIVGTRHALLDFMHNIPDFEALLKSYPLIKAPTLIIHGSNDKVVPLSAIQRIIPSIPHCKTIILDGIGHGVPSDAPVRLLEELDRFL